MDGKARELPLDDILGVDEVVEGLSLKVDLVEQDGVHVLNCQDLEALLIGFVVRKVRRRRLLDALVEAHLIRDRQALAPRQVRVLNDLHLAQVGRRAVAHFGKLEHDFAAFVSAQQERLSRVQGYRDVVVPGGDRDIRDLARADRLLEDEVALDESEDTDRAAVVAADNLVAELG